MTYVACRVADFATTQYAITQLGFVELNKLMVPCIAQGPAVFALCQGALAAVVLWRWKRMSAGARMTVNATSCFAPGFNTYGIVNALRAVH